MAYKYEEKLGRNYSTRGWYGFKSKPTGATIHHWGIDGQRHDNVVKYLNRPRGNTSAHIVTSANRVTRLVKDEHAAWHAGHTTGNGSTIGIECRPEMSAGDWNTLVELCADLEEIHGSLKYYLHSDWKATACPGRYSNRLGELVDAINAEHRARKNGVKTSGNTGAHKPKKSPKPKQNRSVKKMAKEVIAGKHGNGHAARQRSLSISDAAYAAVRKEVNRLSGVRSAPKKKSTSKTVSQMATEVIQGKHGSGHANRRRSLGVNQSTYNKVRNEVNRRAGSSQRVRTNTKSIAQMATEVIQGKHGNGHAARQRSLGVNNATYRKVRAEVNRRL